MWRGWKSQTPKFFIIIFFVDQNKLDVYVEGMAKRGRKPGRADVITVALNELEVKYRGRRKAEWIGKSLVNACLPRLTAAQAEAGLGKVGEVHEDGMLDLTAFDKMTNRLYGKPAEKKNTQVDVFHHYPQLEERVNLEDFCVSKIEKCETQKVIEVDAEVE